MSGERLNVRVPPCEEADAICRVYNAAIEDGRRDDAKAALLQLDAHIDARCSHCIEHPTRGRPRKSRNPSG